MEQPSESETLDGDTKKSPHSNDSPPHRRSSSAFVPTRVATAATTVGSSVFDDNYDNNEREDAASIASVASSTPSFATASTSTPAAAAAAAAATAVSAPAAAEAPSSRAAAPPYWRNNTLQRTVSTASDASLTNLRPPPIQLEDHSDEDHEVGRACWAKHVSIDDYVVVGGGAVAGTYVVWNCSVETLKGAPFTIRKRYSEFDALRHNLVNAFPHSAASIPELPRKSVISRFRPKFLDQRKAGLSHFLNCVLLNPEFSGSPLVKDFVFS